MTAMKISLLPAFWPSLKIEESIRICTDVEDSLSALRVTGMLDCFKFTSKSCLAKRGLQPIVTYARQEDAEATQREKKNGRIDGRNLEYHKKHLNKSCLPNSHSAEIMPAGSDMSFTMKEHSATKQPQFHYWLAEPPDVSRPDSLMPSEQAADVIFNVAPKFCWAPHASLH